MNRQVLKGTIIGIIAPIAAFVVYVAFFTDDADPLEMYKQLVRLDRLTHAMSLSVIINLLIFFMKLQTGREQAARGILLATIIYAFTIMILTFI